MYAPPHCVMHTHTITTPQLFTLSHIKELHTLPTMHTHKELAVMLYLIPSLAKCKRTEKLCTEV